MPSVKVSTKYQISLPSEARRRLGIAAGDRLTVEVRDDELVLKRRPERAFDRLWGLGAHVWKGVDPVEYIRAIRDEFDHELEAKAERSRGDDDDQ